MSEFSAEDRKAISDVFDRLLSDHASEEHLREVMLTDTGFDRDLWVKMAELGLTGLLISEDHGGIGARLTEAEALMEIAGKYLYSGPYISTCVLAPSLLASAKNDEFTNPLLKDIASGSTFFAVAGCGGSGDWTIAPDVIAVQNNAEWSLNGSAQFVCHARSADHILVSALIEGDVAVFSLPAKSPGLTIKPHETNDQTLRLSTLIFENANATRLEGVGKSEFRLATNMALVTLAGEQSGATRRIFEITLEYLNTRFQFGQPIGRFQALKHMAADLLVEVESSSSAARHAARALSAGAPNAGILTYLAAFTCADNFRKIAADAIQLHGGIAYTMEHAAHLYWRRAQTGQYMFGTSDRFRDLYLSQWRRCYEHGYQTRS